MLKLCQSTVPERPAPLAAWDDFSTSDFLLVVKGAPEVLIPRCKSVSNPEGGEPIPLSAPVLERVTRVQEQWARDGQRVLLLACRIVKADKIPKDVDPQSDEFGELVESLRDNLIIVGLVGLIDPLKPSIPSVVKTCRKAGIRFFVVTGMCRDFLDRYFSCLIGMIQATIPPLRLLSLHRPVSSPVMTGYIPSQICPQSLRRRSNRPIAAPRRWGTKSQR